MTIDASLDRRLYKIVRTHNRMRRNGVVHRVGRDGLIRSRPRLVRPRFPLKGALIVVTLLVVFKALLFAQLGAGGYALKVDALRGGSMVEQAGAFIMQEEPVTVAIGGYLKQYIFQR
jgi:hypothetical protein